MQKPGHYKPHMQKIIGEISKISVGPDIAYAVTVPQVKEYTNHL